MRIIPALRFALLLFACFLLAPTSGQVYNSCPPFYLIMVDWKGLIWFRGLIIGCPGLETTPGPSDLIKKSIAS